MRNDLDVIRGTVCVAALKTDCTARDNARAKLPMFATAMIQEIEELRERLGETPPTTATLNEPGSTAG